MTKALQVNKCKSAGKRKCCKGRAGKGGEEILEAEQGDLTRPGVWGQGSGTSQASPPHPGAPTSRCSQCSQSHCPHIRAGWMETLPSLPSRPLAVSHNPLPTSHLLPLTRMQRGVTALPQQRPNLSITFVPQVDLNTPIRARTALPQDTRQCRLREPLRA